jgi:3-oxosteroid 1-dehydrogenase
MLGRPLGLPRDFIYHAKLGARGGDTMNPTYREVDVLVIGSGAAGMTAALTAAAQGLKVLVIEKGQYVGGTSAMSGAGTWVPANHHARAAGIQDSPEEALEYLRNALPQQWAASDDALRRALAENAGPMLQFVEQHSPLRFKLTPEPDPVSDAPGSKAKGRMLSPQILSRSEAGPFEHLMRPSTLPHLMTYQEMMDPGPYLHPFKTVLKLWPQLLQRWLSNSGGQGSALMSGLIGGSLRHGVEIQLQAAASTLLQSPEGAVTGAAFEQNGQRFEVTARRGVLLSTGGFEWNRELFQEHFPGKTDWLTSPRTNAGDGQRLAEEAGALLDRMDQANIHPALPTRYEGKPHGLPVAYHSGPHAIIVDRDAQRFVSEYDYNLGEALDRRDATGMPLHLPAWLIADRRFMTRSLPFLWYTLKARNWLRWAPSIGELARKIYLSEAALQASVGRFNGFCDANHDADFQRGENTWERYRGGWRDGVLNPTLKPLTKGPYFAIPMNRSILGTKGGPRTNERGEVLRPDLSVLPGLYCAGNAMANPIGTRSVGAGTTIGPHMTWGYVCGQSMVERSSLTTAVAPVPDPVRV